jgi:photosystem II stability/assembly factor-like uncharacterized protein
VKSIAVVAAAGMLVAAIAGASEAVAPSGSALDRPALAVRAPERAVLLGAAMAGDRIVAVGERGIVVVSDDGGHRWTQSPTPTSVTLTAVRFVDARRGWAIGHGGTVLVSRDGGASWTRQLDGRRAAQIAVDAARETGDARLIADAERLVTDGPDKPFLDLVVSEKRVLVIGAYGLALASVDGGQTWTSWIGRLPNPKGLHLYVVRQRGDTLLLAGERGLVLMSHDDGQSFRRVETPYQGSFFAAELLTGSTEILLAGLRGNALRSPDGGANWSSLAAPVPVSITATAVDSRGQVLAANQAGMLMSVEGERLVQIRNVELPPLNGLLATSNRSILALSFQGPVLIPAKP